MLVPRQGCAHIRQRHWAMMKSVEAVGGEGGRRSQGHEREVGLVVVAAGDERQLLRVKPNTLAWITQRLPSPRQKRTELVAPADGEESARATSRMESTLHSATQRQPRLAKADKPSPHPHLDCLVPTRYGNHAWRTHRLLVQSVTATSRMGIHPTPCPTQLQPMSTSRPPFPKDCLVPGEHGDCA